MTPAPPAATIRNVPEEQTGGWGPTARYLTYRGLGSALGHLPPPLGRTIAVGVARTMAWRETPTRAMGERHLRRVLASECVDGVEPDPRLVRRWCRRGFGSYARYWFDGARLPYVDEGGVRARFSLASGEDHLRRAQADGRGIVLALPHIGSWEWGGAWLALEGMPMTTVMEKLEPPALFDWFVGQRAQMGLRALALGEGSTGPLLACLREGGLVGLVCDRDIVGNGVPVTFFGERTTMPGGAATLALRMGAALLPVAVYEAPGDWHVGVVGAPLDTTRSGSLRADVVRLTQELADCFETLVRASPEQWHLYQPNWPSDCEVSGDAPSPVP